jgi:hypothetical protein
MTQAQINDFLQKAKEVTDRATTSRAEARKLLSKAGFCTQKGVLKKIYREE